jgi:hypothetical protein
VNLYFLLVQFTERESVPLPTDAARAGARANPSDARALQVQVQVQVLRYRPPRIAGVRLACDRRAKALESFVPPLG